MKAVTYHSPDQQLMIGEMPLPEPEPGQLLLKVRACGICGSDLPAYQAGVVPEGIVAAAKKCG